MSGDTIKEKAEEKLAANSKKPDFSEVYKDLANNADAELNRQERQALSEVVPKEFGNLEIVGITKEGKTEKIVVFNKDSKEFETRTASDFSDKSKYTSQKSSFEEEAKRLDEKNVVKLDLKQNSVKKSEFVEDKEHVKAPGGTTFVKINDDWKEFDKNGRELPKKDPAITDVKRDTDGNTIIDRGDKDNKAKLSETIRLDNTRILYENHKITKIVPQNNEDNRIEIKDDKIKIYRNDTEVKIAADAKVTKELNKDGNETGNVIVENKDLSKEKYMYDGTVIRTKSVDGVDIVASVEAAKTEPNTTTVEYKEKTATVSKITFPDGSTITKNAEGENYTRVSGETKTELTKVSVNQDGLVEFTSKDGNFQINTDGTWVGKKADGLTEKVIPQGDLKKAFTITRESADGPVSKVDFGAEGTVTKDGANYSLVRDGKVIKLDGAPTVEKGNVTLAYDGKKEIHYADGRVVVSKDEEVLECRNARVPQDKPNDANKNGKPEVDPNAPPFVLSDSRKATKMKDGSLDYVVADKDTVWSVAKDLVRKYYPESADNNVEIFRMMRYITAQSKLKHQGNLIYSGNHLSLPSKEKYDEQRKPTVKKDQDTKSAA